MDMHLKALGKGLILCWVVVVILLAIVGIAGPGWDEPFYLPSWTLAALALPLPLCYLVGWWWMV